MVMRNTTFILTLLCLLVVLLKEAYSVNPLGPLALLATAAGRHSYKEPQYDAEPNMRQGRRADLDLDPIQRQSDDDGSLDYIRCLFLELEEQCKAGDFAQNAVDIALSCGNESFAELLALSCMKNGEGLFCAEALLIYLFIDIVSEEPSGCYESNTTCDPSCRIYLEDTANALGCCFSSYNATLESDDSNGPLADAQLWDLCDVTIPAECANGPKINIPSVIDTCTDADLTHRFTQMQCKPSNGQPIVDELVKKNCTSVARIMVEECGTNADGEICADIIPTNPAGILPAPDSGDSDIFRDLITECQTTMSTSCDANCRDFIEDVIESYGCCVHVFNDSSIYGNYGELTSLSYEVWKSCGYEEDTGACTENTLTLGLGTEVKSFAMLVVTAVLLIQGIVM